MVEPAATKTWERGWLTALVACAVAIAITLLPGTTQVAQAQSAVTTATASAAGASSVTTASAEPSATSTPSRPPSTGTATTTAAASGATGSATASAPVTSPSASTTTTVPQLRTPQVKAAGSTLSTGTATSGSGSCAVNSGTGSIDTFMQKSAVTSFSNGALTVGLYEGGYVDERVELRNLSAGTNVLVFTYQVRYKLTWAYDYVDRYSVAGGTLSGAPVVTSGPLNASGYQVNTVTVRFDVATAGAATIYFSAHIASELDHGYGTGAGSIIGAPYHVSLVSLNCASAGGRDNQIMASSIQGASVTIVKQASPADGTPFPFHISLANAAVLTTSGTFTLAVGSSTLPQQVTYGKVAPGALSISEDALPSGWHLSGISCVGADAAVSGQSVTFNVVDEQSVTCTFRNASAGNLTITKVFDPKTSGYEGTFSLAYACTDEVHRGAVDLAAGASATITGIAAGTTCVVSEPALPSAPDGWTFGTPSVSSPNPVTIVGGNTVTVTVTNSIAHATGALRISESTSNVDGAVLPAEFTGTYDCGSGYVGTWSVPEGGSQTVAGIPTGSSCSVSEDVPAVVAGFSWASPVFTPSSVVSVDVKGSTVEVAVRNSITRDRGSLVINKSTSNVDGAVLPSVFTGTYDCGSGYVGTWSVPEGGSQTVAGIPTGSSCSVSEDVPAVVAGFSWAAPVFSPSSVVTVAEKDATVEVAVRNSISRDRGSFTFTKVLVNQGGATVQPTFPLTWSCGVDANGSALTGTVDLAAGASHTVDGIPTGNVCAVSERALAPVPLWAWLPPHISAPVTVDHDEATGDLVTVTNTIVKNWFNLSLTMAVTSSGPYYGGSNVTYTFLPHNDSPLMAQPGWSVTALLPEGSTLVGISGDGYTCYTTLRCVAATGLAAGADGMPITMIVTVPEGFTGQFKAVSYVSPMAPDAPESNPLVVPTLATDTAASATDNDAQAVVDVLSPQTEGIVLTLASTGAEAPLPWLLGALGLVALGTMLLGVARLDRRARKS